jgi:hypothetical protein
MKKCGFVCAALIAGFAGSVFAQQQTSLAIEGSTISVKYSAPSMKGRKIFGATVPYNQVWRIGESAPAALHTDTDLVFYGMTVPKGDYSLYVLVDPNRWQLIVNKQTGPKAAVYNPKLDVGRVPMTMGKASAPVETCKFALTKTAALAAKLELAWENTVATVPFHLAFLTPDREW